MRFIHLSLFLIFLLPSCNDEIETEAQLTAKKLKSDIGEKNILTIYVTDIYDGSLIFEGSSYVITSDGFIVITTNADQSATFNLGKLKAHKIFLDTMTLYY